MTKSFNKMVEEIVEREEIRKELYDYEHPMKWRNYIRILKPRKTSTMKLNASLAR